MDRLRILVADDSQFMRAAYTRILETQDNFEVVAVASDGEEALQKAIDLAPDVAILDVRMPKMNGLDAAHRISSHRPGTAIVIISAYDDLSFVRELIKDTPERKAYLLKNSLSDIGELIRVVEAVTNGKLVLDPGIVGKITRIYFRQPSSSLARLTKTELDVLELMAEGYEDSAIGQTLHLEKEVVADCTSSIYAKLGLDEKGVYNLQLQAVAAFINQGSSVPYLLENEASS